MDNNQNAESLHNVGQGSTSPTTGTFVNKGTPTSPLVTMETLKTDPEISKAASASLRSKLVSSK